MTTKVYIIDKECQYKDGTVVQRADKPYQCTLNQTHIGENNNKYYLMQVIKTDSKYVLFTRYGRVGETRKVLYKDFSNENDAVNTFIKQFKSKTGNNFNDTKFVTKDGYYDLVNVCNEAEVDDKILKTVLVTKPSKLDNRIQELMKLFGDKETLNKSLISLELDTKKMPLGKLNSDQLKEAGNILGAIKIYIAGQNIDNSELIKLCNSFYTKIPYACGRKKPPLINTDDLVDKFTNMVDELNNMVVTTKIIDLSAGQSDVPMCDTMYNNLNTVIEPVEKDSLIWTKIENYVKNTHGSNHNYKTEIIDIYQIDRKGEREIYEKEFSKLENKQLLWHGSGITNFCSILKNGLLLDPSRLGVTITGKMFGYGIYTANAFSKSFNYCNSAISNGIGALLLCEVALGKCLKQVQANTILSDKSMLQCGTDSTRGIGQWMPDEFEMIGDVKIPNGKLVRKNPKNTLLYDEFIVYNKNQLNMKYLVIVKQI
jgi:predicted DNA-binding WGR domain protein